MKIILTAMALLAISCSANASSAHIQTTATVIDCGARNDTPATCLVFGGLVWVVNEEFTRPIGTKVNVVAEFKPLKDQFNSKFQLVDVVITD